MVFKPGVDISYPDIKKAGSTQTHQVDVRATNATSVVIKSKNKRKHKKKKRWWQANLIV